MGRPKQVYAQVMLDLRAREKMGIEKYGVSVDKANLDSLKWMQHAYEESLDHAIYMKKIILQSKVDILKMSRDNEHIEEVSKDQLKLF